MNVLDLIRIGKRLLTLRKQKHLSQAKLGDVLFVTHQAISRWERGEALPSIDALLKLSELYHVSIDGLLCLHEGLDEDSVDALLANHEPHVVIDQVLKGELAVELHQLLPYLTQTERYQAITKMLNERSNIDLNPLTKVLHVPERRMIIHHHLDHGFPVSLRAFETSLSQIEKKLIKRSERDEIG